MNMPLINKKEKKQIRQKIILILLFILKYYRRKGNSPIYLNIKYKNNNK